MDFRFIIPTKNKYEVWAHCIEIGFNYPIWIDIKDEYCNSDKYPEDVSYRCFVLDKENKVKMVGNPVHLSELESDFIKLLSSI